MLRKVFRVSTAFPLFGRFIALCPCCRRNLKSKLQCARLLLHGNDFGVDLRGFSPERKRKSKGMEVERGVHRRTKFAGSQLSRQIQQRKQQHIQDGQLNVHKFVSVYEYISECVGLGVSECSRNTWNMGYNCRMLRRSKGHLQKLKMR